MPAATYRDRMADDTGAPAALAEEIGEINRSVYTDGALAHWFGSLGAFLDAGEQAALLAVASAVRGRRVLDVGVGAGRTTSLLRLLSDDYVAVDYSPTQVQRCREAFPGVDVRVADVRDLAGMESGEFAAVVFSYNGIDMVGHEDRRRAYGELRRVLAPGGLLVLCTLNKDGRLYRRPPWRPARPRTELPAWRRAAGVAARLPLRWRSHAEEWSSWWRERDMSEDHGEWALGRRGSGHGLIAHWVTAGGLRRELVTAGFRPVAIFTSEGQPIEPDSESSPTRWMHAVAARG